MKDAASTPSVLARCVIGVLDAILLTVIVVFVAWLVWNNLLQIGFILGAFALGWWVVLSVTAWRHGLRWCFSRRAWRVYAWLVVGTISAIVLFYAEESWRGKRAWASLQREAAARGESLELSSVFPPPVPDDQNFALAPGLPRMFGYAVWEPGETRKRSYSSHENFSFFHGYRHNWPAANWALQQSTDLAAWQKFFRKHPLTNSEPASTTSPEPETAFEARYGLPRADRLAFPVAPEPQTPAADVLLALSRYDSALAVLRAANERPQVRYPLAYDEGLFALGWPNAFAVDTFFDAVHVLCLRAVSELAQDQSAAALQDTLLALRVADSFRQEPYDTLHRHRGLMLMACLQPIWEGLTNHRWKEAQLFTLQQRFAVVDFLADYRVRVRGETLVMMNIADQFHAFLAGRGSAWGRQLSSVEGGDRFWLWLFRTAYPVGWLYQDKVWMYRFYERRPDVSRALDPANQHQWDAESRRAIDPALMIMVAPKLQETFHEGAQGALFFQTVCQEVTVACALERCRLAQGQHPASLDTLVPAWLKQVPTDLLAAGGALLKYRREADGGFVLYSIGLNRVDDQGKPSPPETNWRGEQTGYPHLDEGDWVWRQPGRP